MDAAYSAAEWRYVSPLRYPGGKARIANYVKALFLENDLVGHEYAEVYAGGAAVALALLFEDYASHIHINDLDPGVYAFWKAVLDDSEALCERIEVTPVTLPEWEHQRSIQEAEGASLLDLAFSTFFLNRTNRSGIIGGGVIGGKAQGGRWSVSARFNKDALVRRIRKVARHCGRISLTRLDGVEFLRRVVPQLPSETLLYLDPPYYVKGGSRLYTNYYKDQDHVEVAAAIQAETDRPWVVSYDRVGEILALYSKAKRLSYGLSYSASRRRRGEEVMVFSDGLKLPAASSPTEVTRSWINSARMDALS